MVLEGLEPSRPFGHPVSSRIVCMLLPLGTVTQSVQGDLNPRIHLGTLV